MNPDNVERKRVSELLDLAYTALDEPQGWNAENLDELRDAIGHLVAKGGGYQMQAQRAIREQEVKA